MSEKEYGEPEDVEGECNNHCYIGDNFGDNHATMRCQLKINHKGNHQEQYKDTRDKKVIVEWEQ